MKQQEHQQQQIQQQQQQQYFANNGNASAADANNVNDNNVGENLPLPQQHSGSETDDSDMSDEENSMANLSGVGNLGSGGAWNLGGDRSASSDQTNCEWLLFLYYLPSSVLSFFFF